MLDIQPFVAFGKQLEAWAWHPLHASANMTVPSHIIFFQHVIHYSSVSAADLHRRPGDAELFAAILRVVDVGTARKLLAQISAELWWYLTPYRHRA